MDKLTKLQLGNQRRQKFAGMTEVQILQSVRALKGHFTRYATEAAALMATLAAAPNGKTLERLENTLAKMAEKQEEFDAAHEILGGMEDVKHEDHEKMFAGLAKNYTKEVENIHRAIAHCTAQTSAIDTAPKAPAFIIKANEGLKPKILGDDTDPVELEPWLKRFRAFYANSQMHRADIEEQRTYLDMYLDGRVSTKMDRLTRTDLPIYAADKNIRTAITVLREIFERKHPIRKRQK